MSLAAVNWNFPLIPSLNNSLLQLEGSEQQDRFNAISLPLDSEVMVYLQLVNDISGFFDTLDLLGLSVKVISLQTLFTYKQRVRTSGNSGISQLLY